jgi:hypothetical protein
MTRALLYVGRLLLAIPAGVVFVVLMLYMKAKRTWL